MHTDEAILLRRTPWRDHHLIVSLYTRTQGRVEAISYGSRGSKSKARSVYFSPLNLLTVTFGSHRPGNQFRSISECSFREIPSLDCTNPSRIYFRQFTSELLTTLLREEYPQSDVWYTVDAYCRWLNTNFYDCSIGTIWLIIRLGLHMGIGININELVSSLKEENLSLNASKINSFIQSITQTSLDSQECTGITELQHALPHDQQKTVLLKILTHHLLSNLGLQVQLRTLAYLDS